VVSVCARPDDTDMEGCVEMKTVAEIIEHLKWSIDHRMLVDVILTIDEAKDIIADYEEDCGDI
jgi:hypothetical protein